jgi:hypothetical protein
VRRLFRTSDVESFGVLRWRANVGACRRIQRGVYGEGPEDPTPLDRARARVLAGSGEARGHLAGVLLGLDAVELDRRPVRRSALSPDRVILIGGIRCANGTQTMLDLAATLDDLRWEQALESALRKRLTTIEAMEAALIEMQRSRRAGTSRVRRVLARRPAGAPPTESLLETLMVQLARTVPGLADPVRQLNVFGPDGRFVARVDLAWPELGIFIELDGQHHKGQPVYDANRETAVVAATGWLCGRFTWKEVVHLGIVTARRLAAIVDQARRRPVAR